LAVIPITPEELSRRMASGEPLTLIDVREDWEWKLCRLPGALHRPLSELHYWQHKMAHGGGATVIYCHHGVRSHWVCRYLSRSGARGLLNLTGGIDRWAEKVDPATARY
jgi:rhodanese-related sulfurtransferase